MKKNDKKFDKANRNAKRCRFPTFSSPLLKGSSLFSSTSLASVPSSIKSSLVNTPIVLNPAGSVSLANLRASDVAKFGRLKQKRKTLSDYDVTTA
uniref:Uncharacterized protein n=1 Tax=Romanomermis culicivorax TaxID=13658 RepID=A0A915KTI6_ROMCU